MSTARTVLADSGRLATHPSHAHGAAQPEGPLSRVAALLAAR